MKKKKTTDEKILTLRGLSKEALRKMLQVKPEKKK